MGTIHLENMEFFSYHGHFKEENIVGNHFIVNLWLETDLIPAGQSDQLSDALNYVEAWNVVNEEMKTPSSLIEHVALRILTQLHVKFGPQLKKAKIKLSKLNPPVGGKLENISVIMEK